MAEPSAETQGSSSRTSDISLLRGSSVKNDNPFSFDGGDVVINIIYKGEKMKGKVVSGSMASASSVWKKFLFPPWDQEGSGPVKELDYTGDDGEALLILLRIVHFQFAEVPTVFKGSLVPFYNVALLCEQYDCAHLVKLLVQGWCKRLNDNNQTLEGGDNTRKAYIAWAFGVPLVFRQTAKTLLRSCRVKANGSLENEKAIFPDKLLESIETIRAATLQKLLDIPYSHIDKCASNPDSKCGDKRCNALIYGSLLLALSECKLWPKRKPAEIKDSISDISTAIQNLNVLYLELDIDISESGVGKTYNHQKCGVNYKAEVNKVLKSLPDPTLECHYRHMALRSGTPMAREFATPKVDLRGNDRDLIPPSAQNLILKLQFRRGVQPASGPSTPMIPPMPRPAQPLFNNGPRSLPKSRQLPAPRQVIPQKRPAP